MKRTTGDRVCEFIETYCKVPEGEHVSKNIKLEPFQKKFIKAVYDNEHITEKAILSIARKNGKTALIAGIVLAHTVGPVAKQNSQIVSGAMSKEQAAIVFNLAVKMINLNKELSSIIRIIPSKKMFVGPAMNVEYRALASDGATAQGLSPVLVILDELGQVKGSQNAFVDSLVTSQGAHESPLLITISTQAPTDADLLSIWIDDARRSKDKHVVCHVYEAPIDADLDDKKAWKQANPALGVFRSVRDMEKLSRNAMRMPTSENSFRNLNLNQRVSVISPFVSASVWSACGDDPDDMSDSIIFGGLDLSAHLDLTAFVLVAVKDGYKHVYPYFWTPSIGVSSRAKRDRVPYDVWVKEGYLRTTPGKTVDYEYVANDILEITAGLNIKSIAFDRWRIDFLKKEFDRIGFDVDLIPHGQGFKDMSPALDRLEADLLNEKIKHGGHPVLTMCASNAVVTKDPAGNRKLDKHKANGRIDGMVALAMALGKIDDDEIVDLDDYIENMIIA